MKYQFNLGNDELVTIDKDKVEEFTTNNPEAKFNSFIDEEASGNTDPSPEKTDAPVEDKDMASRLDSGSLVYQEKPIDEVVKAIQNAEEKGEAVVLPPDFSDLNTIALDEVIITDRQSKINKQRKAIEDLTNITFPTFDEEALLKKQQGEILEDPGVIVKAERERNVINEKTKEAREAAGKDKAPDALESLTNTLGNIVQDFETTLPGLYSLIGTGAKIGLEAFNVDTSDKTLEGKWYNRAIANSITNQAKNQPYRTTMFNEVDSVPDALAVAGDGAGFFLSSAAKANIGVLWADIFAKQIQKYNENKANAAGISLEKLYEDGRGELLVPAVGAYFSYYIEQKQLKSLKNYWDTVPNSVLKQITSFFQVGGKNGVQEYLQHVNEELNLEIGKLRGAGFQLTEKASGEYLYNKLIEIASSDQAIDAMVKGIGGAKTLATPATISNSYKIITKQEKELTPQQVQKISEFEIIAADLNQSKKTRDRARANANKIRSNMYNSVMNRDILYEQLTPKQKKKVDGAFAKNKESEREIARILNSGAISDAAKESFITELNESINFNYSLIQNEVDIAKKVAKEATKLEKIAKGKPITVDIYTSDLDYKKKTGAPKNSDAQIDPENNTISINLEFAKNIGKITSAKHELFHPVLTGTFSKKELAEMVELVKSELTEEQLTKLEKRLEAYKTSEQTNDEILTQVYEVMEQEGLLDNVSFQQKIGRYYTNFLRTLGFSKLENFESGKSVKDFILDYKLSFDEGKLPVGTKLSFDKKSQSKNLLDLYNKYDQNVENMVVETFTGATDVLNTEFGQSIGGLVESITKRLFDKTLPDVTKVIDENRGEARKQFKRQVIEDAAIMVLNEFDAQKQSIDRFISNRLNLRANAVLKNMGVMPSVEKGGLGIGVEVTESVIKDTDEQIQLPQEETKTSKPFAEKLELDNDFKNKIVKAVENTFGTKLPNVSEKKFRTEFEKKNRAELTPIIQKQLADKDEFKKFLIKNYETILGKLPQRIVNKKYKNFGAAVTDETGKQIRAKTTVGEGQFKKVKPTKEEFVDYFTSTELGSSTRSDRKQSLLRTIVDELSFDAALDAISNPDVITKLELQGVDVNKAWTEELKKAIERDQLSIDDLQNRNKEAGIKYSKVIEEAEEQGLNEKNILEFLNLKVNNPKKAEKQNPGLYQAVLEDEELTGWKYNETSVLNNITAASSKIPNLKIVTKKAAGNDFKRIDIQALNNNKKLGIEIKLNENGRVGQAGTITQNDAGEFIFNAANGTGLETILDSNDPTVKKLKTNLKNFLDKASELEGKKIQLGKDGLSTQELSPSTVNELAKTNLQALVGRTDIKVPSKAISNFYRFKDIDGYTGEYLIMNNKNYSLGYDPLNTNSPKLSDLIDAKINIRLKGDALTGDRRKPKGEQSKKYKVVAEFRIENLNQESNINLNTTQDYINTFSNIKYSKVGDLEKEMNSMIERKKGIEAESTFSEPQARRLGQRAERIRLFVPNTAEDLLGLTYKFLGKGKQGDADMKFFKDNLFDPLTAANIEFESAQVESERSLTAAKDIIAKQGVDLTEEAIDGYTNDHVIRIFMWNRRGFKVPELDPNTKGDKPGPEQAKIVKYARQNFDIVTIADAIESAYPDFQYGKPDKHWVTGTITTDLLEFNNETTREKVYEKFFDNVQGMFGNFDKRTGRLTGPIANKIRTAYGNTFMAALESSMYRIYTGRNRSYNLDKQGNIILDWMNNAIGNIMFINSRSALLQTISNINFTNWTDNNPLKIGERWLDKNQFSEDFKTIFFSDYLKARRSGLRTDVQEQEIAEAAKNSKNKVRSMIAVILKKGFMPTQYADSFAIALGGATFYRNRANTYQKQGFDKAEAERKAFADMREIAEDTQQSGRPEKISMEQAGMGGRLILAFQNTPMQYNRLMKRAIQDLYNGRGVPRENISKIIYYGIAQNALFYSMQQALFTVIFDDPETTEEEKKEKNRYYRLINGMSDSILRGSGIFGAIVSTGKNTLLKVLEREGFDEKAIEEIANLSPPLGKKTRQLFDIRDKFQYKQNKEKIKELGLDTRNPAILAAGDALSFGINLPADRALRKINNLRTAMEKETEMWQRIALALGWSEWELNIDRDKTNSLQPKIKGGIKGGIKQSKIK
tara:strand:- start:62 stop:6466 length:6405 start_codon:yes stop_codon:yes gene_type:complete